MSGFRAYYEFSASDGSSVELSADESRHLCGSLRAAAGDFVDVFDLKGNVYRGVIVSANPKRAVVEIREKIPPEKRAADIYLLQCLPKGKAFDDIIRRCVELGAAGVYPLISRFCQVKIESSEAGRKREKWLAQVVEAVKQSSNFSGFEVFEPRPFSEMFANLPKFDLKLVASLEADARTISGAFKTLSAAPKSVAVLIGPEGDMSAEEYARAKSAGFAPITLGRNVLKSDTAAVSAISRVQAALEFV